MPRKKPIPVPAPVTRQVDLDSVVASRNDLLPHLAKLGHSELRLVAFCVAHYDSTKEDGDDRAFHARIADLVDIFPRMDLATAYDTVRQVFLGLGKKPLETQEGRRKIYRNWFSGFDYEIGSGEFTFYIPPETQPFFLRLKESGNFTTFRLRHVYQFRSAHTWKLYENLARWRVGGRWEVKLDELRGLLGVAGKYPRWDSLRLRVVDKAMEEITAFSDLEVTYQAARWGRRVDRLVFYVEAKKEDHNPADLTVESPAEILAKALVAGGLWIKTAEKLMAEAVASDKVQRIAARLPKMLDRAAALPPTDRVRYLTGAIKAELRQMSLFPDSTSHRGVPAGASELETAEDGLLQQLAFAGNLAAKTILEARHRSPP